MSKMFVLNPNPDANWSYLEIQKQLSEDYHIESDRLDCVNDAWESEYDIFLKIKLTNYKPVNIKDLTVKELRKYHNIERLIKAGEFGEFGEFE